MRTGGWLWAGFAVLIAWGCVPQQQVLQEAPPALLIHNRTGEFVVIRGWACGDPPEGAQQLADPIPTGTDYRIPLARGCWSFDAYAGDRIVGRQHDVDLRREMDWIVTD